jgi:hypothetical protein
LRADLLLHHLALWHVGNLLGHTKLSPVARLWDSSAFSSLHHFWLQLFNLWDFLNDCFVHERELAGCDVLHLLVESGIHLFQLLILPSDHFVLCRCVTTIADCDVVGEHLGPCHRHADQLGEHQTAWISSNLAIRHGGLMAEVAQPFVADRRVNALTLLCVVGVALLTIHAAALLSHPATLVHHPALAWLAPLWRWAQGTGIGVKHSRATTLLNWVQWLDVWAPRVLTGVQREEITASRIVSLLVEV